MIKLNAKIVCRSKNNQHEAMRVMLPKDQDGSNLINQQG